MTERATPKRADGLGGTEPNAESMMEMLALLMEEFSVLGEADEAGPHIHQLMGIAYRSAKRGRLIPPRKSARQSGAKRASAALRP